MAGRFNFYERVRVASSDPVKFGIDGQIGAILGKNQSDDGRWWYGVFIYELGQVWHCSEDELAFTGAFDRRESFYSGEAIRVGRDGEVLG
jgi:hypothetical protein